MVSDTELKAVIFDLMFDVGILLQMKYSSCRTLEPLPRELA